MQHANNVDLGEIAKFEALANRWWDPDSEFKPLHDINPLRLNYINERAGLAGKRVVDIGCGGGLLAEGMAVRGAEVLGIDMGEAPLAVAELHRLESQLEGLSYRRVTAEALADEQPAAFDLVTCLEMLEHVPDPLSVIRAAARLVKPGGHLFFSTINRNPKSFLFAIVGAEYLLGLLPRGTHQYTRFIRPAELAGWLRMADLRLDDLTGMVYNPLTRRYRLDRDVDVNYLLHAVKGGVKPMRTLSTVLFDLDGTLLDTAPDFIVVLRQLMQQRQCQRLLSDKAIRETVSEGSGALITLGFGHAPDAAEFEPLRQQLLDLYQRNGHARTRLFAGLAELLDWFDATGIAWGVVTNKPSHYAVPLMQGLDLLPRCRTLVCPDHVTRRKPDPEPILLACRQLDRPVAHTLYIGDHRRDIEAGRAAGALTMAAAYGYVHPADPAEQWQADHLVRSVDEMASWLRQRLSAD